MAKKTIKLTESDLKNLLKESVTNVLNEIGDTPRGQYALSAVAGRASARAKMARANGNQEEYWKQMDKFNNTENYRDSAAVKSKQQGQMADCDVERAAHRGYNYGMRVGMSEEKLSETIENSVKSVLKENAELAAVQEILNNIDVTELIKYGEVEIGDYLITRLSDRMDMVIELEMKNMETGKSAVALYTSREDEEITSEYYAAVEKVCRKYINER